MILRRVLALLVVLILAGCTTIPTSGPIETIPVTATPRGVEIAPEPPPVGVTPQRLVEGFLQAMADPKADYAVARQYLATTVQQTWHPGKGATIYLGETKPKGHSMLVVGSSVGTLDAFGRFTAVNKLLNIDLGLIQEGGQWRIGNPPEGVLLSRYIFERYYAHVTTYFLANSGDAVVPDLIHIPEALLTPKRIIEAQIAGPSERIAGVARNAIPSGVTLGPEGASVGPEGVAKVSLSGIDADLSEERRRQLGAQLVWSLTAIPRVIGLSLSSPTSGVIALPGQNSAGILELATQQGYQVLSRAAPSDLFGIRAGIAGRVTSAGSFIPIPSNGVPVSEVAVSLDGTLIGFISQSHNEVMIGLMGGDLTTVAPGLTELRSAQFAQGMLWVLGKDQTGGNRLVRIDAQGKVSQVAVSDVGFKILDFSLSQTGSRVALVVQTSDGPRFGVAIVTGGSQPRVEKWQSISLTDPSGTPLTNFGALDWSGETEIALLADAGSTKSVFLAKMDGSVVEDLGPVGIVPVSLAALPRLGGDALVIRSQTGRVLRYEARSRWKQLEEELQEVSYPG